MIKNKEQLIERVNAILSSKSFSQKAKENLFKSITLAYEFYKPPKYIKTSRNDYIMEYLKVLEDMNGYAIVELEELNEENEVSKEFRTSIKKLETGHGNLDYVEGKYIPSEKGLYKCTCKGVAWNGEKMMFTLNEHHDVANMGTIHHEMTHLTEGKYPFLVASSIPFSFELREMFYEGRAATRESYIHTATSHTQIEVLEDLNMSYEIESLYSYPLYSLLYQTLQIIFGDDFLEEMSQNDDNQIDMVEKARNRFPNIPVQELFAHLIYILSCTLKDNQNVLATSIEDYADCYKEQVKQLETYISYEQRNLSNSQNTLAETQTEAQVIIEILDNPEKLEKEYQKAKENERKDIETYFKEGDYTETEYREALVRLEQEGTLEYYLEVKKQELERNKHYQVITEKSMEEAVQHITRLQSEKEVLESNQLALLLEKICLKQPSLEASFAFLEEIAIKNVRTEAGTLSEEEKIQSQKKDVLLDKMKTLLELKQRITSTTKKKTSLVS